AISAGLGHNLALRNDGKIVAWGNSTQTNVPSNLSNVVAISAGNDTSLAVTADFEITSIQRTAQSAAIKFHTFAGKQYSVEYSTNLSLGNWSNVPGAVIQGNGQDASVTDSNAVAGTDLKFYRAVASPQ